MATKKQKSPAAKKTAAAKNNQRTSLGAILNNLWAAPQNGTANRENYPLKRNLLLLGGCFLAIFAIFALTAAPTIVTEGDAAEFTAAGKIAGIAHPPGYPCFIIICWLMSKIVPALQLARALNLLSAFNGALACTLLGAIVLTLVRRWSAVKPFNGYLAAILAALAAAMSREIWTQAVSCEVYTLSLAITFGAVLLSIHEFGEKYPQVMLFMLAFGYGIHHTIIVLSIPIIAEYFFRTRLNLRGRWLETALVFGSVPLFLILKSVISPVTFSMGGRLAFVVIFLALGTAITWLFFKFGGYKGAIKEALSCWGSWLAGLLFFLYLPLRSAANPAMDFVNPETYRGFWELVTMANMPSLNPAGRDWTVWQTQFASFFNQWFRQFPAWLFPLMWAGLLLLPLAPLFTHKKKPDLLPGPWTMHYVLLAIFLGTTWGYITITNFTPGTSFENEVRVFYLPGYAVGALTCGLLWIFITSLGNFPAKLSAKANLIIGAAVLTLFLSGTGWWLGKNWHEQDKSKNYIAYNYGLDLLHGVQKPALLFTPGDNAAQPIFYFQQVEKRDLDVAAVHLPLIPFPWYQDMLNRIYPDLVIPPKAMVPLQLIRANINRRHIYFARRIDERQIPGYRLQPEGFLYRVLPKDTPTEQLVDIDVTRYKHLLEYPKMAMDLREQSMYAEYRDGFFKQGLFLAEHGEREKAIEILEFASSMPQVAFSSDQFIKKYVNLALAQNYLASGKNIKAATLLTQLLHDYPDFQQAKILWQQIRQRADDQQ